MSDLLVDSVDRARYNKAKNLVRYIYLYFPPDEPAFIADQFCDYDCPENVVWWTRLTRAYNQVTGSNVNTPSQETVSLIQDLIELVEKCRAPSPA